MIVSIKRGIILFLIAMDIEIFNGCVSYYSSCSWLVIME
jgi:hypothetical protein